MFFDINAEDKKTMSTSQFWDINHSGTEEMVVVHPVSLELCNPVQPGR